MLFITVNVGALGDGMTATTQAVGDNSTKVATTAYVDGNDIFLIPFLSQALSPADSTSYYIGPGNNVPGTTDTNADINLGFAFKITGAIVIIAGNTTAGTSENCTLKLRNTTQATSTSIGTFQTNGASATITTTFTFTGLDISVASGDSFCGQVDTPAWATNPAGSRWYCYFIGKRTA